MPDDRTFQCGTDIPHLVPGNTSLENAKNDLSESVERGHPGHVPPASLWRSGYVSALHQCRPSVGHTSPPAGPAPPPRRAPPSARHINSTLLWATLIIAFGLSNSNAAEEAKPDEAPTKEVVSIFPDKALEKAVRHQVFAKRENDEPITAEDVADVAIIEGKGFGIKDLTGLEHCKKVALISFPENQITVVAPLAGLARLQSLDLSKNQIKTLAPLTTNTALQYLDVSFNQLKELEPVAGLTNLATLLVSHNALSDLSPAFGLPRLHSLHVDGNRVNNLKGIANLNRLDLLSASDNRISDLAPMQGLTDIRMLILENNRLKDLQPLVDMAVKDGAGERRFAPFLRLYLKGNKLTSKKAQEQLDQLRGLGVKVNIDPAD